MLDGSLEDVVREFTVFSLLVFSEILLDLVDVDVAGAFNFPEDGHLALVLPVWAAEQLQDQVKDLQEDGFVHVHDLVVCVLLVRWIVLQVKRAMSLVGVVPPEDQDPFKVIVLEKKEVVID